MNPQTHLPRAKQESVAAKKQKSAPQQEGQASQPDYLDLPGVRTLAAPRCQDFSISVEAEQLWSRKCPKCGCDSEDVRPNGTRWQSVLDEPRGLKSVRIRLRRRSYKCRACGTAGLLPLGCIVERRGVTRRLVDYVKNESLLRPFSELAQGIGLSPRTVREMFWDSAGEHERAATFTAPRVMGIDGVHVGRKERAILTNIKGKTVIDIWGSAKGDLITPALKRMRDRDRVEVVVMDMSGSLRSAVEKALPDAVIVTDRYHIQRMANQALIKVRNRLRHDVQRRHGQPTMCKSSLLRKHPNGLKGAEKAELEMWFGLYPELRAAYELKERFYAIWHTHSKAAAEEGYRRWLLSVLPELREDFGELITAMREWGRYVFNFFDHPYTNGFTESTNRRVKDIQREARRGGFETVRAKVIYGAKVRRQMREARERQAKPRRSRSGAAGGVLVPVSPLPPFRPFSLQMSLF